MAMLAFFRIVLPTTTLLAQFAQFSPIERVALLVKVLSPLFVFLLASSWVSVLLWLGSELLPSAEHASRPTPEPREALAPRYAVFPPEQTRHSTPLPAVLPGGLTCSARRLS